MCGRFPFLKAALISYMSVLCPLCASSLLKSVCNIGIRLDFEGLMRVLVLSHRSASWFKSLYKKFKSRGKLLLDDS